MTDRLDPTLTAKADRLDGRFALWAGPLTGAVNDGLEGLVRDDMVAALYARRPSLWSDDAGVQSRIANRLGWLASPEDMLAHLSRIEAFAADVRASGATDVVLLGMGGSSLAPEVLRAVIGPRPGWMAFHMLDSTDPAAVAAIERAIDLRHTIFVLASKSGGTIEPNAMASYFRARLGEAGLPWPRQFVAITDEGTSLHRRAVDDLYRDVFVNPADIGGRYSVLSFFGLVPAALMGIDVRTLVDWARAMLFVCGPDRPVATNSAALLGIAMAVGARSGRDKLTLVGDPRLGAFGLWVEQLVAESTGKSGTGVIPIAGEALAARGGYGDDRLLVHLSLAGEGSRDDVEIVRQHAADGVPFAQIELPEPEALGAEFVRWELATAMAGVYLGVNPFDEPNVQQAKDATSRLLHAYASEGQLPAPAWSGQVAGLDACLSAPAVERLGGAGPERYLTLLGPGDYFAILAYLGPGRELAAPLEALRAAVRDSARVATTFGYGPRYLHSTGQLHKGGPDRGVFLLVASRPAADLAVPDAGYTFGTLELAQALGDLASLDAAGRRVLYLQLPEPDPLWLQRACDALASVLHNGRRA